MKTAAVGIVFGVAMVALVGCKKAPVAEKDTASDEARASEKAERVAKKAAADAKANVDEAIKTFGDAPDAEKRRDGYVALLHVLEKSKPLIDAASYKGIPVASLTPLLGRLAAIQTEEDADEKSAPNIPPKPEHDPPKYTGAFNIWGQVRKCYKDGIVVETGGKFYFISDATCPDTNATHGWVEEEGKTVNVDIGRDGREAIVVKLSDKESADDDHKTHRKAVADYEADYAKKLKEYQDATNGKEAIVAALEKRRAARKTEREAIYKSIDSVLVPLAAVAASGGDLSTAKLPTVTLPSAASVAPPGVAIAPPPAGGSTPALPKKKKSDLYGE